MRWRGVVGGRGLRNVRAGKDGKGREGGGEKGRRPLPNNVRFSGLFCGSFVFLDLFGYG